MSKNFYWMKMYRTFFSDPQIKKLRRIAGGDTYTVIYQKMMLLSIVNGGVIHFEGIEESLPKELSLVLDEDEENVKVTLVYMQSQNLIEQITPECFLLPAVPPLIGKEGDSAERVRRFREKKKVEMLHCNDTVTRCNSDVTQSKSKIIEKEIKPSLLLSPVISQKSQIPTFDLKDIKSFREHLSDVCPTFQFSLAGEMGYTKEHRGFCLKSGYIFSLHTNKLVDRSESFEIWQHLFYRRNKVFELANTQIQNKKGNHANDNR